jgi:hypothetical protein
MADNKRTRLISHFEKIIQNECLPIGPHYKRDGDEIRNPTLENLAEAQRYEVDIGERRMFVLLEDMQINTGIKNRYNGAMRKRVPDFKDHRRFGHPTIAENKKVFNAGFIYRRRGYTEVVLASGRYHQEYSDKQRALLEVYLAKKFMHKYGTQKAVFYDCHNSWISSSFAWPVLKFFYASRTYTAETVKAVDDVDALQIDAGKYTSIANKLVPLLYVPAEQHNVKLRQRIFNEDDIYRTMLSANNKIKSSKQNAYYLFFYAFVIAGLATLVSWVVKLSLSAFSSQFFGLSFGIFVGTGLIAPFIYLCYKAIKHFGAKTFFAVFTTLALFLLAATIMLIAFPEYSLSVKILDTFSKLGGAWFVAAILAVTAIAVTYAARVFAREKKLSTYVVDISSSEAPGLNCEFGEAVELDVRKQHIGEGLYVRLSDPDACVTPNAHTTTPLLPCGDTSQIELAGFSGCCRLC